MIRTQISLTKDQKRMLDARSAETGLSLAALVRHAIERCYPSSRSTEADLQAIEDAHGAWTGRDFDGAEFVERLRSARRLG